MNIKTRTAGLALTGALAPTGVAACESNSPGGPTPSGSNTPIANIPNLTGLRTQVALDSGFVSALLFLDGRTLQPLTTGPNNTAILTGKKVYLTGSAATLLDRT